MSRDPVSLSHRFYRWLLNAYPPGFQSDYGPEMARVFRDSCRADYRQRGTVGLVGQWATALPDLAISLADEHSQDGFQMAKTNLIRVLALAGIVGGALWIAAGVLLWMRPPGLPAGGYREADDLAPLLFLGVGFGAAGLLGIFLGPGRQWPAVTRFMLLLAMGGGLWAALSPLATTNFFIFLAGFLVYVGGLALAGLTLFALSAARQWATLCTALALTLFIFNLQDWRAVFGAVAGLLAIVLSALMLQASLGGRTEPPVAA